MSAQATISGSGTVTDVASSSSYYSQARSINPGVITYVVSARAEHSSRPNLSDIENDEAWREKLLRSYSQSQAGSGKPWRTYIEEAERR